MLKGTSLIYIRHERNRGVSKTDKQYDFATATLSDGLESFKMDLLPALTEMPIFQALKKGDKINIDVEVFENFGKSQYMITQVTK